MLRVARLTRRSKSINTRIGTQLEGTGAALKRTEGKLRKRPTKSDVTAQGGTRQYGSKWITRPVANPTNPRRGLVYQHFRDLVWDRKRKLPPDCHPTVSNFCPECSQTCSPASALCRTPARSSRRPGHVWERSNGDGILFVVPDNHRAELIHKKERHCVGYHRSLARSALLLSRRIRDEGTKPCPTYPL